MNTADPAQVREIIERLRALALRGLPAPVEKALKHAADLLSSLLARAEEAERRANDGGPFRDKLLEALGRLMVAEQENTRLAARVEELEDVLRGFEGIGFKPCKDTACYRPTLEMMKRAHAALHDAALSRSGEPQTRSVKARDSVAIRVCEMLDAICDHDCLPGQPCKREPQTRSET